jgi:hypothetical protein
MDELKRAIQAAGEELRDIYEWSLDEDTQKPVLDTLFCGVLLKHITPLVDPISMETARRVKIAALRAELYALESA